MNDADELIGEEDINEDMLNGKEDVGDVDSDLDFCLLSVDRRTKVHRGYLRMFRSSWFQNI